MRITPDRIKDLLEAHIDGEVVDIRAGGYSLIYVVEDAHAFPRRVAYKTLKPSAFGDESYQSATAKFEHEARVWFDLAYHPNILHPLRVLKLGQFGFILMPYCEDDLRHVIADPHSRLGTQAALWIAIQIASGIAAAQAQGLVAHQDLKPENVLFWSVTGEPAANPLISFRTCVADFGLANAFLALGIRKGTLEYMAPEQFDLKSRITSTVDSYAFGLILWEMLTKQHPVVHSVRKAWKKWSTNGWQSWHEQPKHLSDPRVPPLVADLVNRLIRPEATARPTILEAKDELLNALDALFPESASAFREMALKHDKQAQEQANFPWNPSAGRREVAKIGDHARRTMIKDNQLLIDSIRSQTGDRTELARLVWALSDQAELLFRDENRGAARRSAEALLSIVLARLDDLTHLSGEPAGERQVAESLAEALGWCVDLLSMVRDCSRGQAVEDVVESSDARAGALALFNHAGWVRIQGEPDFMPWLDRAIDIYPNEAIFFYFKVLWRRGALLMDEARVTPEEVSEWRSLLERAVELDRGWASPRHFLDSLNESG